MLLKDVISKIKYYFIKNMLKLKKENSEKIKYYLKHEDIFFSKFNKNSKINIEYDSVLDLLKICEKIEELYKKNDSSILPKIPEQINVHTLELFFSFENAYIENIKEVNNALLKRIIEVYDIDRRFIAKDYKFFSSLIQPHIIILEKYLNVLFKTI